jgi:hypothetical protein
LHSVPAAVNHDTTLEGDGTTASPLKVVDSGGALKLVIGVPEFILNETNVFNDGPTTEGKEKFHINYPADDDLRDMQLIRKKLKFQYLNSNI